MRHLLIIPLLLTLLLLTGAAAFAQEPSRAVYSCRGNEPFWSLEIEGAGARLDQLGAERMLFDGSLTRLDYMTPPWALWRGGGAGGEGDLVVAMRAEICQDTMSDEGGAFDLRALLSHPDGRVLTGCCRAAAALDLSAAPVADFEGPVRGDWSDFLPRLLPAMAVCLERGFEGRVIRLLGAWPMSGNQALVRAELASGGRADCFAAMSGNEVLLSGPVSVTASSGQSEGQPAFLSAGGPEPVLTCGRAERVELTPGELLGWLHYPGPGCR